MSQIIRSNWMEYIRISPGYSPVKIGATQFVKFSYHVMNGIRFTMGRLLALAQIDFSRE